MNATLRAHRASSARAAFAVSILLLSLSGCSENEQEAKYSPPRFLCGIAVDTEALAKFLPAGKKVSTKATATSPQATRCSVSVDGKRIVYTAQEWWNNMSVLNFAQGLTLDKLDHQTDDGRFAYSGNEAFGKTEGCHSSRGQVLYTAVQAAGSKHSDAEAMKKLITTYTEAVEKSRACD
jgi:hypothetical protein